MTAFDPDHARMQRVALGDAQAFRELSGQHLQAIVTYTFRITQNRAEAEEIAQEVFLRVWQRAADYRPEARVSTWLHQMAHHLALDVVRRRRPTQNVDDTEAQELTRPSNNPAQLLERKNTAQDVLSAVAALPERQRQALLLAHEQGLSNPEIADVLGVGVAAVESLLSRARRSLREALTPEQVQQP